MNDWLALILSTVDPLAIVALGVLFAWLGVCVRLRRYAEMPIDEPHPSEIAPDGCYAAGDGMRG